jgi:stage IV sporulation protein FB
MFVAMESEFNPPPVHYPPKPVFPENNSPNWPKTIGSLALFMVVWYLITGRDIVSMLVLVFVLFVHEAGHFIAMRSFGYRDVKMFFVPLFGAFVSGTKTEISQHQRLIILLAGPIPGILLGVGLFFAGREMENEVALKAAYTFVVLNVFNLIPVSPLDGGGVVETLFFSARDTLRIGFMILSMFVSTVFAIYYKHYLLLIIPFSLYTRLNGYFELKKVRKLLDEHGGVYDKTLEEMTDQEYWELRHKLTMFVIPLRPLYGGFQSLESEKRIVDYMEAVRPPRVSQDLSFAGKLIYFLIFITFLILPALAAWAIYTRQVWWR